VRTDARPRAGILERVLERWQVVPPPVPTVDALDELHAAYLRNVPFENATKLIKAARVMSPDAAIRGPVEFWEDHLRWGSGGTCFASSYAYQFLLRFLGFRCQLLFCHLPAEKPQAHTALAVEIGDSRWLVDVGYALPTPVALPTGLTTLRTTPLYDIEIRRGPHDECLLFTEDDRGQRFRYRFIPRAASEGAYLGAWRESFRLETPYMRRLALGRFQAGIRYLYKEPGRIYAISRQGEETIALNGPEAGAVADFFQFPEVLVDSAITAMSRLGSLRLRPTG
jgi:arylamine N-acetyltransferase